MFFSKKTGCPLEKIAKRKLRGHLHSGANIWQGGHRVGGLPRSGLSGGWWAAMPLRFGLVTTGGASSSSERRVIEFAKFEDL